MVKKLWLWQTWKFMRQLTNVERCGNSQRRKGEYLSSGKGVEVNKLDTFYIFSYDKSSIFRDSHRLWVFSDTPAIPFVLLNRFSAEKNFTMSWQSYVDDQLLSTKMIKHAVICGHDGNIWASSAGFAVSKYSLHRWASLVYSLANRFN